MSNLVWLTNEDKQRFNFLTKVFKSNGVKRSNQRSLVNLCTKSLIYVFMIHHITVCLHLLKVNWMPLLSINS